MAENKQEKYEIETITNVLVNNLPNFENIQEEHNFHLRRLERIKNIKNIEDYIREVCGLYCEGVSLLFVAF